MPFCAIRCSQAADSENRRLDIDRQAGQALACGLSVQPGQWQPPLDDLVPESIGGAKPRVARQGPMGCHIKPHFFGHRPTGRSEARRVQEEGERVEMGI